jgi:hypothetical protein
MKVKIRLAEVPKFAFHEYNANQLEGYRWLTEITFKVLTLPVVSDFLDAFTDKLGIQGEIEARVCRVPSAGETRGRLLGSHRRMTGAITLYPCSLWADPKMKPDDIPDDLASIFSVDVVETIIHELLHRSGIQDENRVMELEKEPCEEFMRLYSARFSEEFNRKILGPYLGHGEKRKQDKHTP